MDEEQKNVIEDNGEPEKTIGSPEIEESETIPVHPIAQTIDTHILRICDLRANAFKLMKRAAESCLEELEKYKQIYEESFEILEDNDSSEKIIVIKNILDTHVKIDRINKSELLSDLATGHFLTLFATFDAFTGDLLTAVYAKKPELFNSLDRSMSISEMLTYGNVDDIKKIILASEIEAFRRKSYLQQFQALENRFVLNLRKFKNWSKFVECGQRRNLFSHCDGRVSEQYISICNDNEFKLPEDTIVGSKLKLSTEYLFNSCNLIIEVILKLGQTIWRKLLPQELEEADKQLISIQYDFLRQSDWRCAIMAGDYAVSLPNYASTVNSIILMINHIIALKNCKLDDQVNKLLDSQDWSALCNDFRIAEKVLREDYDAALDIMEKIGMKGDFIDEHAYHVWPLFREFRQTEQFLKGYKKVYGYDFATKLKEAAEESSTEAEAQISRKKEDIETLAFGTEQENYPTDEPQLCAAPDREKCYGLKK
ncbi:MAG: hypothetical protein LWX08_15710 [Deltaproteobacteria bacterium]|jgi:hypothetical protein|nr:hypothetical protein [Deltaproteobacteria bacterium]